MSNFYLPRWTAKAVVALLTIAVLLVVFRMGTQASADVALNDPVVWVEDGARGRLLQINGSTQEITAEVDVGDDGDSLVAVPRGRDAVFMNRTTGVVGVVGAVSLAIDSEDAAPGDAGLIGDESIQLLANHQGSRDWDDAFLVGEDKTLIYEPGAGVRLEIPTPTQSLSDTVVNVEGELVAITGDSSRVVYSTALGLEELVTLPPLISENAARPGLARAGESVYLVDSARRVVNELTEDDELGEGVPICGSPGDVQIAGNVLTASDGVHRILVHDALAGLLSVVEPIENECRVIELGETGTNWGAPVAVDGFGFLPNYDSGEILIVDLVDRVVTDSFKFRPASGQAFELEVFDGAVWANEPDGFRAAIVTGDEIVAISKLGAVIFGGDGSGDTGSGAFTRGSDEEGPRVFADEAPAFTIEGAAGNGEEDGDGEAVLSNDAEEGQAVDGAVTDPPDSIPPNVDPPSEGQDDPPETVPPSDGQIAADFIDPDDLVEAPVGDLPDEDVLAVEEEVAVPVDELLANFVFSADTVNVGEEVRLSDDSTGDPTSWNWDFGDGTSATGPDVSKIWAREGVFTVTLFAANADGEISQQTHEFTVIAENVLRVPSAGFTLSGDTVEVGETVTFSDTSTGDPQALFWDFGDGTTGSGSQVSHRYSQPGVYTVTLTASNDAGPNSVTTEVTVVSGVDPPVAVIAPFTGVVEVGQTVTLTSESTNTPTATSWSFDDGETALGETVRHAWDRPGEYRIRLSVSNSAGSDETVGVIVVEARVNPPIARFSETALTVVQGEELRFSDLSLNAPTSMTWEFGDGATATGANVGHSWSAPGTYTVTLTASNDAGSDTVSKTVTVDPLPPDPPSAAFSISATTVQVNSVVVFTDTSTGSPTGWSWNFGDGTGSSSAPNPTYSFSAPGSYTVSLTASNAGGSDQTTATITVVDPPSASFTFNDNELAVAFTDTSVNGPTSWAWDFGDGNTSTAQNPNHTYGSPGPYTVTLVASNGAGDSIPFSTTVNVDKAPTANFNVSTGGLTAQFSDTSTDGPTSYAWDFDDGSNSSSPSPTHTYGASGTYDVTLTVTNTAGSDSITKAVTVALAPPEANVTCNVVGAGVACDGSSSTSAATYSWTAVGATTQNGTSGPNPTFSYNATGNYDITLTVENTEGTQDSETVQVSVTVPQPPVITGIAVASNTNDVVVLNASATNSPTSWSWSNLGDGTITSGANSSSPTISFATSGPKTVTATATNAVGTSAPDTASFTVNIAPPDPVITSINGTNNGGVIPLSANVTNTPVSYAWSSTGGSFDSTTSATPTLTVAANGTYTVTLTVDNGAGGTDTATQSFTVGDIAAPPAVISAVNVGSENPAGTVTVSAVATNAVTWNWSVPAASSSSGTNSATPTFTFGANGGPHSGTVTAFNADGVASAPANFTITINGFVVIPPPVASFTASTTPGSTLATFTFTGSNQPGATISWAFTGGTPGSANGATASSDFVGAAGTSVSVTVTVTDPGGASDSSTQNVPIPP